MAAQRDYRKKVRYQRITRTWSLAVPSKKKVKDEKLDEYHSAEVRCSFSAEAGIENRRRPTGRGEGQG